MDFNTTKKKIAGLICAGILINLNLSANANAMDFSPNNGTPYDLSQGYGAVKYAATHGMTAEQVRQQALAEATARRKAQLDLIYEGEELYRDSVAQATGIPRPVSPANVKALTPQQRLRSYLSGLNPDPELAYDLENSDEDYLEAKYGAPIANYAAEQRDQSIRNFSAMTSYIPEEAKTGGFWSGLAAGIVNGARDIVNVIGQAGIMAFNSGEEQADKLREWDSTIQDQNMDTLKWAGNNYEFDSLKKGFIRQVADEVRANTFSKVMAETGNHDYAVSQAKIASENFDDRATSFSIK